MDFLAPEIEAYVEANTKPESALLQELNRETYAKVLMPRMLSGHVQGKILEMFSHMIQPRQVLEIGTYTGYSAICLAAGLQDGGMVHTIDINEELREMVEAYFARAEKKENLNMYVGAALEIIPTIDATFDLVFIDADKENYSNYFDLVIDRVRPGGFIIADNVLWSGKVLEDPAQMDADTAALKAYSEKVTADGRVDNVLMPVRDGLMVARKL